MTSVSVRKDFMLRQVDIFIWIILCYTILIILGPRQKNNNKQLTPIESTNNLWNHVFRPHLILTFEFQIF